MCLRGWQRKNRAIATDNRGHREIIRDGENGFLIKIGDSAAFACRIEQLYHKPELCKKLGQEGRKTALRFSESRTVEEMADIYSAYMDMDTKEKSV